MRASKVTSSALVVGAGGGLGSALVEVLAAQGYNVCASYRALEPAVFPGESPGNVERVELDLECDRSIDRFGASLEQWPDGFDLVIHAAGLLHNESIFPEKSLQECDRHTLQKMFEINAIAPLLVAREVFAHQPRNKKFTYAALSAMVGSIGDNRLGGWYGYRASKAALNQFVRTLSRESRLRHPGATVLALHPGTTDTALSRPFQANVPPGKLYAASQSAQRILDVVRRQSGTGSGKFFNWDGAAIPW